MDNELAVVVAFMFDESWGRVLAGAAIIALSSKRIRKW